MKKIILLIVFIILITLPILAYVQKNFASVIPIIKPPPDNIATILENNSPKPGSNNTSFPLTLPENANISIFASNLANPRVLVEDPSGNLLVSVPSLGKVLALPDKNKDGKSDNTITVAENLSRPHGLLFKCNLSECKLFVAETDKVSVFDYDKSALKATFDKKLIDLPGGGGHYTRTLSLTPDKTKLLISVGSSCNVCNEENEKRATILSANFDGSDLKIYAKGLRNSVFMTHHPITNDVYATEMGRDLLGDDIPPDEINIIKEGANYGWPVCFGKNIHDTNFDKKTYIRNPCQEPMETPSLVDIPAHSAPLGLAFITSSHWPKEWQNDLLVSYHGSWNRSTPTGYKIVKIDFDEKGNFVKIEDFITGFIKDNAALGRPVDILEKDDKFFISDDKAGVIYQIIRE